MVTRAADVIVHRRWGTSISFAADGIIFQPLLCTRPIVLSWGEVEFISPTPAAEKTGGAWRFKELDLDRRWDLLRRRGLFYLDVVVPDRHALRKRLGWYPVKLRALWTAEGTPHPTNGFFQIELHAANLSADPLAVLDLIGRHARLDLLHHEE
jgi:hypothetical protein